MRSERVSTTARAAVAVLVAGWLATAAGAAAEEVNRVVLRVNDEIATLQDYELRRSDEIARVLADPRVSPADRQEKLETVGREVMSNLFGELLLVSYADQHGIRIGDSDVDEAIQQMQTQRNIGSRAELEQALAASNLTYDELRTNISRELLWNQVIGREVQGRIEIGEEEVRAYYRNHLDEFEEPEKRWLKEIIVLESSGLPDAELRQLAQQISDRLAAGEDLEAVAASTSGEETTTGAIDLGWLGADEIGDELAEVAWSLEAGSYSAPIQARGGYHVLYVAEIKEAQVKPFPEVEEQLLSWLRNRDFNRELRKFMAEVEQQAYVHENLPPEAVGYQRVAEGLESKDELEAFRAPVLPAPTEQGNSEQGNSEQGNSEQGNSEQGNSEQGNSEQGAGES
jgi:peptidyl-prolyl cis-trans isomerase SurA